MTLPLLPPGPVALGGLPVRSVLIDYLAFQAPWHWAARGCNCPRGTVAAAESTVGVLESMGPSRRSFLQTSAASAAAVALAANAEASARSAAEAQPAVATVPVGA